MSIKKTSKKEIFYWGLIVLPYLLIIPAVFWYFNKLDKVENSSFIIINKGEMTLSHYNYKGNLLQKFEIATGKHSGTKQVVGDGKTPEGIFSIVSIENSLHWEHDFVDDTLGKISGAYGPYFIRLQVPGQKGIGIHGTHDDGSIGKKVSEGCIRMRNVDLTKLVNNISTAAIVVITPSALDVQVNEKEKIEEILNRLQPDETKQKIKNKKNTALAPTEKIDLTNKNKK